MKENPGKALFFWLVVIFTVWAVWWNIQSILLTAVATLALLGALTSFFLPTRYRLDAEGASWERLTGGKKLEWRRVRSVSGEKEGVFLSPYPVKSRMENFRGIYLPYRGNRDKALEVIAFYTESPKETPPETPASPNYFGHRRD